jgi:hypothetical protein
VDWRKRDLEIAAKIEPAVMSMQNSTAVPKRITVTAIGIRLGLRSLLEKKLHKLPRTAHKLREMADSDESFIERRIEFSVRQMEAEGIPTKPWRVLRRAAIRDSALVQEVISRKLGRVF